MQTEETIKQWVREKYGEIALTEQKEDASCCESTCCSEDVAPNVSEDYATLKGYNPDADLGLGCGLPTQFAKIKPGDTVVDLGAGAGNDCFVARESVGESGRVVGIDMTEAMVDKARRNAEKLGVKNAEFHLGEIENLPLPDAFADVVVSNCVLNLVPDKSRAFAEIHRVLKPGGHFSISDLVTTGPLPKQLREAAALYVGCISGALTKNEYLQTIREREFTNLTLQKERRISLPEELLVSYLTPDEIRNFKESGVEVLSITVYGEK